LRLLLLDSAGNVAGACDAGALPTSRWIKGPDRDVTAKATFSDLPPGRYTLRILLLDPATDRPIELPLGIAQDGSYGIGDITCGQ